MNLELKIIPPVQFVISALLMFTLTYFLPQFHFSLAFRFPLIILLIALASFTSLMALSGFHKHKTTFHPHVPEKTTTVVNSGIYAYSRNPMYLALALVLFALAFYFSNITCFAVIPIFIWYITQYQIKPEEVMLDKLFPLEYQAYSKKVRRWL